MLPGKCLTSSFRRANGLSTIGAGVTSTVAGAACTLVGATGVTLTLSTSVVSIGCTLAGAGAGVTLTALTDTAMRSAFLATICCAHSFIVSKTVSRSEA